LAPLEPEVLEASVVDSGQITKMFWSYGEGEERTPLESNDGDVWKSRYSFDLNLEVETKYGNDGKTVKITIEDNGEKINIESVVFENKAVFEKVFEGYV
jgi:hypothetical protein